MQEAGPSVNNLFAISTNLFKTPAGDSRFRQNIGMTLLSRHSLEEAGSPEGADCPADAAGSPAEAARFDVVQGLFAGDVPDAEAPLDVVQRGNGPVAENSDELVTTPGTPPAVAGALYTVSEIVGESGDIGPAG